MEEQPFVLKGLPKPLSVEEEVALGAKLEGIELFFWKLVLSHPETSREVKHTVQKASWRRHYCKSNGIYAQVQRALALSPIKAGRRLRKIDSDRWLARAACDKTGSQKAKEVWKEACQVRNEYVSRNLRLTYTITRQIVARARLPFEDLFQEGVLGLMTAVNRFDYRRGFRFSTYASWWIRHHIQRALADKSREVRLPVGLIQKRRMYTELAEGEGKAAEKAREVVAHLATKTVSLEGRRQGPEGEGLSLKEVLPAATEDPADNLAQEQFSIVLNRCLSRLSFEERELLRRRFGLQGKTPEKLEEIAVSPHFPRKNRCKDGRQTFTRQLVQQKEAKALHSLRKSLAKEGVYSAAACF